jgi:hypothetical protein
MGHRTDGPKDPIEGKQAHPVRAPGFPCILQLARCLSEGEHYQKFEGHEPEARKLPASDSFSHWGGPQARWRHRVRWGSKFEPKWRLVDCLLRKSPATPRVPQ